jgi:spore germination protein KB
MIQLQREEKRMIEKEVISGRQLLLLVFTFVISTATLFLPAFVTVHAGQDGWLSVMLGGAVGVIVVLIVTFLGLRYPGMTLIEYSEIILGKWPGKIIGLIFIFFYLHLTSVIIREVSTTINGTLLQKTSPETITIVIFITCAYTVKKGLEVITRANVLNLVTIYLAMFTVLILLLKDLHFEFLTPVLSKGILPVIQDSFSPAGWFCEVVSIAFLMPNINKPKEAKMFSILAILWVALTLMVLVGVNIMIFGPQFASIMTHPSLRAVRYININNYIQRVDIIFLVPWIMSNYIKICVFFYITVQVISRWLKIEKPKTLILPIGTILFSLSLTLFKSSVDLIEFLAHAWGFYSLPIELGIPALLLLIELLRGKRRKKSAQKI